MNPLLMVWNRQEVVVTQFAHFYNEILMVLESPGSCREAMIDGLDSPRCCCGAIHTLSNEISMVLEYAGHCCESIINGLGSPGSCCEAICICFQ